MVAVVLRDSGDPPQYGEQDYFTLEIRHGGVFNQSGEYVGGIVHWADYHDVDKFSIWELEEAITHLGYRMEDICFYFYHIQDGLLEVNSDIRALQCAKNQSTSKISVVYLSHNALGNQQELNGIAKDVAGVNETCVNNEDDYEASIFFNEDHVEYNLVDVNVEGSNEFADVDDQENEDEDEVYDADFVDEDYVQSDREDFKVYMKSVVHALYKRPAYDRSYQRYISPMSSSDLWPRTQHRPLKPPAYVKQPGRPKKKRIKEVGEVPKGATKLPRYDVDVHCGKCGAEGHNRKSCSQATVNDGASTSVIDNAKGRGRGASRGRGLSRGRRRGRGMSSGSGLEPPARQTTADNESSRGRSVIRVRGRSSTRARGRGLQVQASTYESVNKGGHVVELSRQLTGTRSTQSSQANNSSYNEVRPRNAVPQRERPWKL